MLVVQAVIVVLTTASATTALQVHALVAPTPRVVWRHLSSEKDQSTFFQPSYLNLVAWRVWRSKYGLDKPYKNHHQGGYFWELKHQGASELFSTNITYSDHINPNLVIEMAPDRCVKLSSTMLGPLLWYRVEKGWYGCHYVRRRLLDSDDHPQRDEFLSFNNGFPKIRSADIENYREYLQGASVVDADAEKNTVPQYYKFWAKTFAKALSSPELCPVSPLGEGFWYLEPQTLPAGTIQSIVQQAFDSGHANFDCRSIAAFTLRPMSHESNGRVKWWRKVVRQGLLPPILLYWFSGLDSYIVLDGHDRLLAAALENKQIDAISLVRQEVILTEPEERENLIQAATKILLDCEPGEEEGDLSIRKNNKEQEVVNIANRMLVEAYSPKLEVAISNNMVGGMRLEDWKAEVSDQLVEAYGSSINANSYLKLFEAWGQSEDNAFWDGLLDQIRK